MEISIILIIWVFAAILGFVIGLMLIFYLRSERMNDKLIKTEDALIQLAGKDDFFERKNNLLRSDELTFYNTLQKILDNNYYLFPQIHLSELVKIKNNNRDHENLYSVIGNKSVDYVVFSKPDMSPILAIELNGEYHFTFKTQNKDKMKEAIFKNVGIKFLPVDKKNYKEEELSQKIKSLIEN